MVNFKLTDAQLARYHADGYLLVDSLFDEEEIELILRSPKATSASLQTLIAEPTAKVALAG